MIPKLWTACCAIRASEPFKSLDTLKLVYYSYFHSLMNNGIIFWGNSSQNIHVFRLLKRIIRLISRSRPNTCRALFKYKDFTIWITIYIFTLTICSKQKDEYKLNSDIHNINTGQNSSLYQPLPNFIMHQNGASNVGIRILILSLLTKICLAVLNNFGLKWSSFI